MTIHYGHKTMSSFLEVGCMLKFLRMFCVGQMFFTTPFCFFPQRQECMLCLSRERKGGKEGERERERESEGRKKRDKREKREDRIEDREKRKWEEKEELGLNTGTYSQ